MTRTSMVKINSVPFILDRKPVIKSVGEMVARDIELILGEMKKPRNLVYVLEIDFDDIGE